MANDNVSRDNKCIRNVICMKLPSTLVDASPSIADLHMHSPTPMKILNNFVLRNVLLTKTTMFRLRLCRVTELAALRKTEYKYSSTVNCHMIFKKLFLKL